MFSIWKANRLSPAALKRSFARMLQKKPSALIYLKNRLAICPEGTYFERMRYFRGITVSKFYPELIAIF
jgi:hypothetical protein